MSEVVEAGVDNGSLAEGLSRRDMLRRGGFVVGATLLWTTPVVQTIGLRPAAASTLAQFCPDGRNGDSVSDLVFRFMPRDDLEASLTGSGSSHSVNGTKPGNYCDVEVEMKGGGKPSKFIWRQVGIGQYLQLPPRVNNADNKLNDAIFTLTTVAGPASTMTSRSAVDPEEGTDGSDGSKTTTSNSDSQLSSTESGGTESGSTGTESGGTESGGTESGGTESGSTGTESGGTESGGTESGGTESGGTESGSTGTESGSTDTGSGGTESGSTGTESGSTDTESGGTESGSEKVAASETSDDTITLQEDDGGAPESQRSSEPETLSEGSGTQVITIHLSCSSPIICGAAYASLVLVGGKNLRGEVIPCEVVPGGADSPWLPEVQS